MMETVVPNAVLFVRLSSIGGFRGVDTPEALPGREPMATTGSAVT